MDNNPPGANHSPWHQGELAIQQSVDAIERMADVGSRFVRDHLIDQHREFYSHQTLVVLGAVDSAGDAWATLRWGEPGFLDSPDPHRLEVRTPADTADPAQDGMHAGQSIGLLGIDLRTRRRNRLNGPIVQANAQGFTLSVDQSYGNCPQYIQVRDLEVPASPGATTASPAHWLEQLDTRSLEIIAKADTFFVASYVDGQAGSRQVDVSHRGGAPGFVRANKDATFTIPDYSGNRFFNTLGNLLVNPKAGLAFIDFERGDLLQLTGDAEVILDSPEIATFPKAERLWRFTPSRALYRPAALPLRWTVAPSK